MGARAATELKSLSTKASLHAHVNVKERHVNGSGRLRRNDPWFFVEQRREAGTSLIPRPESGQSVPTEAWNRAGGVKSGVRCAFQPPCTPKLKAFWRFIPLFLLRPPGLSRNGKLVMLGVSTEQIPVTPIQLIGKRRTIVGSPFGTGRDSQVSHQKSKGGERERERERERDRVTEIVETDTEADRTGYVIYVDRHRAGTNFGSEGEGRAERNESTIKTIL